METWLPVLIQGYFLVGLFFGLAFIWKGVEIVDEGMQGAGWVMRTLLLPGSVVFWPVLLRKWWQKNRETG